MPTVAEAVDAGVAILAGAKHKANQIKEECAGMKAVYETVRDAGHIGPLECKALTLETKTLVSKFDADLYILHSKLTQRCKDLGIDIPSVEGGGDR